MKIFEFNIDNTIDIITNSSSELFVLKGKNEELVGEMISDIYPDYKSEYNLISLDNASEDELDTYISSIYESSYNNPLSICMKLNVRPSFLYKNFGSFGIDRFWHGEYSNEGREVLMKSLPKNTYLLFSLDENPNWDYQEKLMNIATRYHLG